jgi:hypothetical protein
MRSVRWAAVAAALVAAVPVAARAQQTDWGLRPDSAGIPADTVRLPSRRVDLVRCDVLGYRVVDDSAAVRRLRDFPQCRGADFGDPGGRTLVGLPLSGDCQASFRIDAWRSERRREYRILVTTYGGGCRAWRGEYHWLALPKLPAGWRVGFSERRARDDYTRGAEELPFTPDGIYIPQPGGPDTASRKAVRETRLGKLIRRSPMPRRIWIRQAPLARARDHFGAPSLVQLHKTFAFRQASIILSSYGM